jgi:glycosyltransferase involved in cell wall biosynthesis
MKIGILNNAVPFVRGGAEHLADALRAKLCEYGHQALLVRIPFRWDTPSKILEHMLACRLMRMPGCDRVIALKFPAMYVPHENKVIWLLHQFRQVYDLWGTSLQGLPNSQEGREIRDFIFTADNSYLAEAKRIFTNSDVTSARLKKFNGLDSEVLHPPLLSNDQFSCSEYGDYVFAPGRINGAKRQSLLVESMEFCRSNVKLIVAGKAETKEDAETIKAIVRKRGLQNRVDFIERFITEDEKVEWLSRALACAYIPYDEDSYGYVTLESFLSKKPVLTCLDSGGIHELVKDHITGRIVASNAKALAAAMDALYENKASARRMGESGYDFAQTLDISWDRVIRVLTG